jgi:hypothetical protein
MAAKAAFVLSHWYHLFERVQESPQSFYGRLEQAVKDRALPDAVLSRVDHHEGGPLSAKREYLRVMRTGYMFDVCAAPFGNGFFVSWWLAKALPTWGFWAMLGVLVLSLFVLVVTTAFLGVVVGLGAGVLGFIVMCAILGDQLRNQGYSLEDLILTFPLIGGLYKLFFLGDTYFKTDTALMFQESVRRAVLDVLDQITEAKGMRVLSETERKPILNSLFTR